ncbi:unnamed protein product [Periconia digitata]|uniref:Uncharacterized protein n=1 Tax=Periconia digitata TaxID=1303443 RepID=A0A9W4XW70_9PLEO|nr:unnamed protein product [Periconia digitata]
MGTPSPDSVYDIIYACNSLTYFELSDDDSARLCNVAEDRWIMHRLRDHALDTMFRNAGRCG